jgi:hypothetical protein
MPLNSPQVNTLAPARKSRAFVRMGLLFLGAENAGSALQGREGKQEGAPRVPDATSNERSMLNIVAPDWQLEVWRVIRNHAGCSSGGSRDRKSPTPRNPATAVQCRKSLPSLSRDQALGLACQSRVSGPNLKARKLRFVDRGFQVAPASWAAAPRCAARDRPWHRSSAFTHNMAVRFDNSGHVGYDGGGQTVGGV